MMNKHALVLLAALAFACEADQIAKLDPDIEVRPARIHFDTVPWHSHSTQRVEIHNRGEAPLEIQGVQTDDPAFVVGDVDERVAAGGFAVVDVRFAAGETGEGRATFSVRSNDPDTPILEIPIVADRRDGPVVALCYESADVPLDTTCEATPSIDFGTYRVGERRRVSVMLRNEGDEALVVDTIAIEGKGYATMQLDDSLTLARGETHHFDLDLVLDQPGETAGTLTVRSNDPTRPTFDVSLVGRGETGPLCVEPLVLDFGVVPLGEMPVKTLSIENCGDDALEITSVTIDDGPFSTPMTDGVRLSTGGSVVFEVPVTYAAVEEGHSRGRLIIDTSQGPAYVDVFGGAARCVIRVPERIELVAKLGEQAEETVVIENPGTETCVLTEVGLSTESRQIAVDEIETPIALAGGASVSLTLRYTPLDLVRDELALRIASDSDVQPLLLVPIVGVPLEADEPCEAGTAPNPLFFGVLEPGETRSAAVVLFGGEGPCAVTEIALASAHPDLALLPHGIETPYLMEPYELLIFGVRFTASEAAEVSAVLRLGVNAHLPVLQTPIGGYSATRSLCIEPDAIEFGETPATVTLRGCGTTDVTISSIDLERGDGVTFARPTLPRTLAVGEQIELTLTHDGSAVDDRLVVVSDDAVRPEHRVRVQGGPRDLDVVGALYFNRANETDFGEALRYGFRGVEESIFAPSETTTNCRGCHVSSPDGRYAVSESQIAPGTVSTFDARTGRELALPHPVDDVSNFAFDPNLETDPSYRYVFSAGGDLHIGSLATGYVGKLRGADDPDWVEAFPVWASDGTIVFARGAVGGGAPFQMHGEIDLFEVDESGGVATPIAGASGNGRANYYPDVSPDGRYVVFTVSDLVVVDWTTFGAPDAQLAMVDRTDGTLLSLAAANGPNGASTKAQFSPDGRHIAFASNREGGAGAFDTYLAPIDPLTGLDQSAIPLTVINTELGEHVPSWGP